MDKCAPHPWARAQTQPLSGKKIKSILLLFCLCNFFAQRNTPDPHTNYTRTQSVIYVTQSDQSKNGGDQEKYNKLHHNVSPDTKTRDFHPYASPEGPEVPGTRWRNGTGPLGAAMRLSALGQTLNEYSRHPKRIPKPKRQKKTLTPTSHLL